MFGAERSEKGGRQRVSMTMKSELQGGRRGSRAMEEAYAVHFLGFGR